MGVGEDFIHLRVSGCYLLNAIGGNKGTLFSLAGAVVVCVGVIWHLSDGDGHDLDCDWIGNIDCLLLLALHIQHHCVFDCLFGDSLHIH